MTKPLTSARKLVRRVLRWTAIGIVGLLLVVVLALVLLTQTQPGRDFVLRQALHVVNTQVLEGEVRAGRLSGPILGRLALHDVEVQSLAGRRVLALESLEVRYRWWPLLRGEVRIEEVRIRGLMVDGRISEDGELDLAGLVAPSEEASEPSTLRILLESLDVEAERIVLRDGRNRDARLVDVTQLALRLHAEVAPEGIELTMPMLEAFVWLGVAPTMEPVRAGLRGTTGRIDDDGVYLGIDRTFAGDTVLEGLALTLLFDEIKLFSHVAVDIPRLLLDPETLNALHEGPRLRAPLTLQASVAGPPEAVTAQVLVQGNEGDGEVETRLTIDLTDPFDPGWAGRLGVRRLKPHLWLDLDDLSADVSLSVLLEGRGMDPDNLWARADVDIGPSHVMGWPIYHGWLHAGWERDRLRLEELRIEAAGVVARLTAAAGLDGAFELGGVVRVRALEHLEPVDVELPDLRGDVELTLQLEGQIPLDALDRWQALAAEDQVALAQEIGASVEGDVHLDVRDFGLEDIGLQRLQLHASSRRGTSPDMGVEMELAGLSVAGETLDAASLQARWLGEAIAVGLEARRDALRFDAPELLTMRYGDSTFVGALGGATLAEGSRTLLRIVEGARFRVAFGPAWEPVAGRVDDLELRIAGAELTLGGSWDASGEVLANFEMPQLALDDVAALARALLPEASIPHIEGVLALQGSVQGRLESPVLDGSLSLEAFRMPGFDPPISVRAKLTHDARGISLRAGVDELLEFARDEHGRWSHGDRPRRRGPRVTSRVRPKPSAADAVSSDDGTPREPRRRPPRSVALAQFDVFVEHRINLLNLQVDALFDAPFDAHLTVPALTLDRLVTRVRRLTEELDVELDIPDDLIGTLSAELSVDGTLNAPWLKGRVDLAGLAATLPPVEPLEEAFALETVDLVLGIAYDGRAAVHEAGIEWQLCWFGDREACREASTILATQGAIRLAARPEAWETLAEVDPAILVQDHIREFTLSLGMLRLEELPAPLRGLLQEPRGELQGEVSLVGPSLVFSAEGDGLGIDDLPSFSATLSGELAQELSLEFASWFSERAAGEPDLLRLSARYEMSLRRLLALDFRLQAPFAFRLQVPEREVSSFAVVAPELEAFEGTLGLLVEGGGTPLVPWVRGLAFGDALLEVGGRTQAAEVRFGVCQHDAANLGVYLRAAVLDSTEVRRTDEAVGDEAEVGEAGARCPSGLIDSLGDPERMQDRKEPLLAMAHVAVPLSTVEALLRGQLDPEEAPWRAWPVSGALHLPNTDLAALLPPALVEAWIDEFSGRVGAHLAVGRTLGNPEVTGTASMEGVRGTVRALGRRIEELSVELRFEEDGTAEGCQGEAFLCQRRRVVIPHFLLRDSQGSLRMTALGEDETPHVSVIGMTPERVNMRVVARDLWAMDEGGTAVAFTGAIDLDGTFEADRFLLTVTLDDTTLRIPQEAPGLALGPSSLPGGVFFVVEEDVAPDQVGSLEPRLVHEEDAAPLFDVEALAVALQIRTRGNNRVVHPLARLGYTVELDIDTVGQDLRSRGSVTIPQGEIRFAGREFRLDQGVIAFQGVGADAFDPRLDIRAVYVISSRAAALLDPPSGDQATITIVVTGQASDPQIAFRGDPEMSEEEAIFLLLTGRPRTQEDTDADAGSQVAAAAGSLLLGVVGDRLAGGLPVDTLRIEGDSETGQAIARVEGGFYLSDNVYFSTTYMPGAREGENDVEFGLEWILRRLRAGSIRLVLRAGNAQRGGAEAMYNVVVP